MTAAMPDGFGFGKAYTGQDPAVGQRFKPCRRTITATDLVDFMFATGMLELFSLTPISRHGGGAGTQALVLLGDSLVSEHQADRGGATER